MNVNRRVGVAALSDQCNHARRQGGRGNKWGANGATSSEMEKKVRNRRDDFGRIEVEPMGEA